MSEFFPSEDDELGGENSERDFGGRASITLRPQRKPPTPVIDFDDDDSENGGDEDDHQKNGGGKRVSTTMSIESVRILSGKNANTKRVKFTPSSRVKVLCLCTSPGTVSPKKSALNASKVPGEED